MSAKKKAKKRLPKPVPCEVLMLADNTTGNLLLGHWSKDLDDVELSDGMGAFAVRVRIAPVAKRRKGAK